MAWLNKETIWSCSKINSKEAVFIETHIKEANRPIDLLEKNAIAWNIDGDCLICQVDPTTDRKSVKMPHVQPNSDINTIEKFIAVRESVIQNY